MSDQRPTPLEPWAMLLSAALFAYFGFFAGIGFNTPGVNGQVVPFRPLLGWTLRGAAIAFLVAGLVTFAARRPGVILYAVVGLISAVLFAVVVVMDLLDAQHGLFPYAPLILGAFAIWNGYGSIMGLRDVLRSSPSSQDQATSGR